MSIARSSYYRRPAASVARAHEETALRDRIESILAEFPAYGYRRVTHELRRRGVHVNHKRVARIMRVAALTPKRVRRFLATTNSDHSEPIFPNLLRHTRPMGPNQVWVADLTYIRLATGFVYLAVVLDAWSRKVVGYAISHLLDTRLCLAALEAAIEERSPPPGLVHHSDRGGQLRFNRSSQQGQCDPIVAHRSRLRQVFASRASSAGRVFQRKRHSGPAPIRMVDGFMNGAPVFRSV